MHGEREAIMASTAFRQDPRGPLLEFSTKDGLQWAVSLETLSQLFGPHARHTLKQWTQEMLESGGNAAPTALASSQAFPWEQACEVDERDEEDDEESTADLERAMLWSSLNGMTRVTLQLFLDGNQWGALVGENLSVGVAGFGDSVNDAVSELATNVEKEHRNWLEFQ
jgi:hypothetical protein